MKSKAIKNQRFIAGATCPECQSIDSIILDQQTQKIQCVECDYQEKLSNNPNKNTSADDNKIDIKILNNKK